MCPGTLCSLPFLDSCCKQSWTHVSHNARTEPTASQLMSQNFPADILRCLWRKQREHAGANIDRADWSLRNILYPTNPQAATRKIQVQTPHFTQFCFILGILMVVFQGWAAVVLVSRLCALPVLKALARELLSDLCDGGSLTSVPQTKVCFQ